MEFPKKGSAPGCRRGLSTETCECQSCSSSNQEVCVLCGKPSPHLSDELIGGNLPDNTCQCFLSNFSEIDSTEEGSSKSEQKTKFPSVAQSSDSQKLDLFKQKTTEIKDEFCNLSLESSENNSSSEKSKTPEFCNSSNGYALSLELSDRYFTDNTTNNTTPSSGEDSKSSSNTDKEINVQNLDRNDNESNFESEIGSKEECTGNLPSIPSPTKRRLLNNLEIREGGSSTSEYGMNIKSNNNRENQRAKPVKLDNFSNTNLNIGFQTTRPSLPRPFSQPRTPFINYARRPFSENPHPFTNPAYRPFPRSFLPRFNPVMNAPMIGANIVAGRFQTVPHPRQNISNNQRANQSMPTLDHKQQLDSEGNRIQRFERIEKWLDKVECVPPSEEPSSSDSDSWWAQPENQNVSEVSTDDRSSTEISEEENRRQRQLRRPPRYSKKNRPK